MLRAIARLSLCCGVGALILSGSALAAVGYPDKVGDVKGGAGPDLAAVTVSHTKTHVTFRFRFTTAPPLRASTSQGWVDMLLVGIDVPPLRTWPRVDGEWLNVDFAAGTHGPSGTGVLSDVAKRKVAARFPVAISGSTVSFSIPRRALRDPGRFTFRVAVARELAEGEAGGGVDYAPASGAFRYTLPR